jgi:hypothetical protein
VAATTNASRWGRSLALAAAFGLALPAFADLDFSAISARVDAQAAATTGRTHAAYVRLQQTLARPDQPGLADDFRRLRIVAQAAEGRLSADMPLKDAVTDALVAGGTALSAQAGDLVELAAALDSDRDRARCGQAGAAARRLADRANTARAQGRAHVCAHLERLSALAYARGTALATRLLARQNRRPATWSVPLHDLGGALLSIWAEPGLTPAVYVVGADTNDGAGPTFLRMGGEGWVRVPVATSGTLWWVTGAGDQVFAAGTHGLVVRYDPSSGGVTDISPPVDATLYGVWGSSATDVWTVGGNVDGTLPRTALWHYDGNAWTSVDQPAAANNRTLFKVWGAAADDVWACGQAGLLLHFDGSAWSVVDSATFESLFTVHGSAPTVAVGGSVQPTIVEKAPQGFVADAVPSGSQTMRGVFVPSQGDAWSCGLGATVLRRTSGQWQRVAGLPDATGRDFHAVFVDGTGGVWLAGGDLVQMNAGSLFYFGPRVVPSLVLPQAKLRARVQPALYLSCALTACHVPPYVSENLDLSTADTTIAGLVGVKSNQSPLLRVLPGRPSQSYIWHKLSGTQTTVGGSGARMPNGGPYLPQSDMDAVRAWILEGARDN